MKKILIILVLSLMMCGCNTTSKNEEIKNLMKKNEYIIIDVRTKEEYQHSHIEGAINIPYDEINKDVSLDKEKLIFVYCKSGNRSSVAYSELNNLGYKVYDMGAIDSIELQKE